MWKAGYLLDSMLVHLFLDYCGQMGSHSSKGMEGIWKETVESHSHCGAEVGSTRNKVLNGHYSFCIREGWVVV